MSECLMNEYIKTTKKHINEYVKLVFDKKLTKEFNDIYLENYLNTRYFNFSTKDLTLKNKVFDTLEDVRDDLINKNKKEKQEIEILCELYKNIAYLDNIVTNKSLKKTENDIEKLRNILFKKENETFKTKLHKAIIENEVEMENLLTKYETDSFYLKFSHYEGKSNIQRINLKYKIKMPMIYSNLAIEKAFNEPNTSEDKLFVEYNLIILQIINDIKRGNVKKHYILEYSDTLLKKQQKNARIMKILDNPIVQEKVSLKLKYSSFIKNKEAVYDLIRNGFKIAIILDDKFTPTLKEIEKLGVFSHVLIHSDDKNYKELTRNMSKIKNIIEI